MGKAIGQTGAKALPFFVAATVELGDWMAPRDAFKWAFLCLLGDFVPF
jgi:hypothetical protein